MQIKSVGFAVLVLMLAVGCLDPYPAPKLESAESFLVVDAVINSSIGVATVKLSRSVALSAPTVRNPVTDASVRILDDADREIELLHGEGGVYTVFYAFETERTYRLDIRSGGETYASDAIVLQRNVPIDSLEYTADDQALQVRVYAHDDDAAEERYFRYDFDATYEYRSPYSSSYVFEGGVPRYREPFEDIYSCWLTIPSNRTLIVSTEGLERAVVAGLAVEEIPKGDSRLWFKYSVEVRQYALDKNAFEYWSQLQKVSESLGGLFDPIPFSVQGNLRCESNPDEQVLGYFSGGEVTSSRLTIRNVDLPRGYFVSVFGNCVEEYVEIADLQSLANRGILLTRADYLGIFILGYYFTSPECADCRYGGGTTNRPPFM